VAGDGKGRYSGKRPSETVPAGSENGSPGNSGGRDHPRFQQHPFNDLRQHGAGLARPCACPPGARSLPIVLQAANRGKELVKQIISFSRQKEWERKPLEVSPIVKEGLKFLRSTLPKDIAIVESVAVDCGSVLADPSQVHQILVNLCQNASLAMADRAGQIEVKLEPAQVDADLAARHPDLKRVHMFA